MRTLRAVTKSLHSIARDTPWRPYSSCSSSRSSRADLNYQIPLCTVQTWETNLFGRTHLNSLSRYRASNLAFDHYFFDSASRDHYMEENWPSSCILDVYRSARHGVTRADIFRYCYIFNCGGFYTDIANVPPSPLLTYLYSNPSLVLFTEASGFSQPFFLNDITSLRSLGIHNAITPLYNAFFAAAPSHKIFEFIIDYICRLAPFFSGQVFPMPRQAILALTGPAAFNYGVQRYLELYDCHDLLIVPIQDPNSIKLPGSSARYLQVKSYMDLRNELVLD